MKESHGGADSNFDWTHFGASIGTIFTMLPQWNCILGTLDKEVKERKKSERTKKTKENLVVETLEEIENKKNAQGNNEDEDEAEATNGRSLKLQRTLEKTCIADGSKKETRKPTSMLDLLIDIEDPVQTIENFFDFSFLVKNKKVAISEDKANNNELMVQYIEDECVVQNDDKKQMVMRIDMKDLLQMIENNNKAPSQGVNTKKRTLTSLHRNDELYRAADAHEQANLIAARTNHHVKASVATGSNSKNNKTK